MNDTIINIIKQTILLLILGIFFPSILIAQQILFPYLLNGLYGVSDDKGKIVIEPAYEEVNIYNEFDLIAIKQGGLWGFINKKGNILFNPVVKVEGPSRNYFSQMSGPIVLKAFEKKLNEENEIFTNANLFRIIDEYAKLEYFINPYTPQIAYTPFVDSKKIRKEGYALYRGRPDQTGFIKVGTRDQKINFVDSSGQVLFKNNVYDGEVMSREIIAVQNENGMIGLFDKRQQPKSDFIYKKVVRDNDAEFIIAVKPDSIKKYVEYYSLYATSGKLIISDQVHQMTAKGRTALVEEDRVAKMYNHLGELVAKFENAELSEMIYEDDLFWISINNQIGIVDDKGNYILKPRYTSMKRFSNGKYSYAQGIQGGLLDEKLNPNWAMDSIIIDESINGLEGYYKIQKEIRKGYESKNLYGIVDSLGKVVIPIIYNGGISYYPQSKVIELFQDSLRSLIRLNGQVILPFTKAKLEVDDIKHTVFISFPDKSERLDMVTLKSTYSKLRSKRITVENKNNLFYIADENQKPLCEPVYKSIETKSNPYWDREVFIAKKLDIPKEFVNVYNDKGHLIIPEGYGLWNRISPSSFIDNNVIVVMNKEDVLRMDKENDAGKNAVGPYRSGVINFDGEWIISPDEQITTILANEIIQTVNFNSKKSSWYNMFGKSLTNKPYTLVRKPESSSYFRDNRIIVGMPQDPAKYEQFARNIEQVKSMEQFDKLTEKENLPVILLGAIDITGKEVIPLKYLAIKDFHMGVTAVKGKDKEGKLYSAIIDTVGKELLRTMYDELSIDYYDSTLMISKKNELYGAIDISGNVLLDPTFGSVEYNSKYRIFIVKDGISKIIIFRDSPGPHTVVGPAASLDVRDIGDEYFFVALQVPDKDYDYRIYQVFTVSGRYVGDYSGYGLGTKLFGAELPNGYIAVTETKDSKPYVVNLASGMKYKKN